ncbi:MAG: hypothetical protein FWC20_08265 [Oscillospiraceae bacterium]|nr:hypothetical protein [Oscillospiraceae bacterium]MCL2279380.1 hypothetical protein [Oscillospiraceae bacterium]
MKKIVKCFFTVVLVAVIMVPLVGCGDDSLDGTWRGYPEGGMMIISFSGNSVSMGLSPQYRDLNGTFTISGNKIEFIWTRETITGIEGVQNPESIVLDPPRIEAIAFSRTENTITLDGIQLVRLQR